MVVTIIFKLLNFAVVCIAIWYASINYLIPYACHAMQEYDNFLILLLTKKRHLKEQENEVLEHKHQQDLFFLEAEKKFKIWKNFLEKQKSELDTQQCKIEKNLHDINQEKLINLQTQLAQKQLFPEIIQQAESEICKFYESEHAQDRYMNRVFEKLQKGKRI